MLNFIRDELYSDFSVTDIQAMTFSKSQAVDMGLRMLSEGIVRDKKTAKRQCSTIHSVALRACREAGIIESTEEQIIQLNNSDKNKNHHYKDFAEKNNLKFSFKNQPLTEEDDTGRDQQPGNELFQISGFLTASLLPPGEWRTAASHTSLKTPEYMLFSGEENIRAWQEFKTERELFEHDDYVKAALDRELPPPGPVLVVDEYQDVSPLQDALIRFWIEHPDTERVYLAGDPDQSIYGFRGCSPELFRNIPATDKGAGGVYGTPVSRRCPISIVQQAERILQHEPNIQPTPERQGQVLRVNAYSSEKLAQYVEAAVLLARKCKPENPQIYILSRFRQQADKIAFRLSEQGVPCSSIKPDRINYWLKLRVGAKKPYSSDTIEPYSLLKGIMKYQSCSAIDIISESEAVSLVKATMANPARKHIVTRFKKITSIRPLRVGDVIDNAKLPQDNSLYEKLNLRPWLVNQIRKGVEAERQRGFSINPNQIKIDTIHQSKGLEAPVVFLHTGHSRERIQQLINPERMAEERRVYFVGATRASHKLIYLDYGQKPAVPILGGVL
ncbi:3'-5' exonuclease [Methanoplanus endosymbiosus]|uniref:DNA 3'-5' helicase n=1 Tax=Methanoplanus endosymbiosus TaxID=33865 RepID=A0A9E7PNV9_9EURY|nr:ATP-dependent helicase [Methanoplanus endosymbiosus]UUX93725.1 ATP-dependent helicase [Methanoplanus endosymbiosus]